MRPIHRWFVVAGLGVLLVLAPMAGRAIPAHDRPLSAGQVLSLVRDQQGAAYTGTVESQGRLGLPLGDHFTDLADLLGGQTRLRVWWLDPRDWRVDRLLDTGEVDLFHHDNVTTQWDYERAQVTVGSDPQVRLPRDTDLLPPQLAAFLLTGATAGQVSRLPARRIAGHDGLGLRLRIEDPRSTLDHVDLWVEADTGLVLAVDVYADGGGPPVVTTSFTSVSATVPDSAVLAFHAPAGIRPHFEPPLDVFATADQLAPLIPPDHLAGLARSNTADRGVGTYGRGASTLLAVPLPRGDAAVLADQLCRSGARMEHGRRLLRVGPLGVMLTSVHVASAFQWLVTGTVTDRTLRLAAAGLESGATYRETGRGSGG